MTPPDPLTLLQQAQAKLEERIEACERTISAQLDVYAKRIEELEAENDLLKSKLAAQDTFAAAYDGPQPSNN